MMQLMGKVFAWYTWGASPMPSITKTKQEEALLHVWEGSSLFLLDEN